MIVPGKLFKDRPTSSPIAVGDDVELQLQSDDTVLIEKVLPRKQYLIKPGLLSPDKRQVMAANLDQLVIVSSTENPKFKAGLIDRFLVSAEKEHLPAIIVINKIDLRPATEFDDYKRIWNKIGYRVLFTSAIAKTGLTDLVEALTDKSSALAGHSGVGKSSLLNAIQSSLHLKTAGISKSTGRGVHTTTSVVFHHLDFGGWVADTPGLKVFGIVDIARKDLYRCFPEFNDHIDNCRFTNCQHIDEPGCGIKQAIESGDIARQRYNSYYKLWQQLDN
jgi:ribosome biogenesis GTPase